MCYPFRPTICRFPHLSVLQVGGYRHCCANSWRTPTFQLPELYVFSQSLPIEASDNPVVAKAFGLQKHEASENITEECTKSAANFLKSAALFVEIAVLFRPNSTQGFSLKPIRLPAWRKTARHLTENRTAWLKKTYRHQATAIADSATSNRRNAIRKTNDARPLSL